jgi:hypothetical protein
LIFGIRLDSFLDVMAIPRGVLSCLLLSIGVEPETHASSWIKAEREAGGICILLGWRWAEGFGTALKSESGIKRSFDIESFPR